jgi:hypothetical protein
MKAQSLAFDVNSFPQGRKFTARLSKHDSGAETEA